MIREHRIAFKMLRLVMDVCVVTAAYYALYFGTLHFHNPLGLVIQDPDYRLRLPLVLTLCWIASLLASGVYKQGTRRAGFWTALSLGARVLALMLLIFALGLFLFKIQFLSRKFMVVYAGLCLALLCADFSLGFSVLKALRAAGGNTLSVLLIGEGAGIGEIWGQFEKHREWGYRVVGLLGLDPDATPDKREAGPGARNLGGLSKLDLILRTRIVDEIIIAAPFKNLEALPAILQKAGAAGVSVRVLVDSAVENWQMQADRVGSLSTLSLSLGVRAPYLRLVKRVMDGAGAAFLLVLLSPVFLLVALAILASMGRPIFFVQKRAGRNGRAFFLYKFRTMVRGARGVQESLASKNQMTGPVFKVTQDPRVTSLGRILRRYSLDELPQLVNVVTGELSLVGPRPLAKYEARKVPAWAWRRYSVKPGITCLWQVMGRNQIDFDDWMRLDLQYIDQWSLWLDLKILARTLPAVLGSKGAS